MIAYDFDWVFLKIPVKNCIVGMLLSRPIVSYLPLCKEEVIPTAKWLVLSSIRLMHFFVGFETIDTEHS